jgi:hypothetical protein
MKVEILLKGVLGEPLIVDATLVIVRLNDTTPVLTVGREALALSQGDVAAVAGDFGPDGVVRASHALDPDFNPTLRAFGIERTVICDRLVLPQPPPGAQIIRGPDLTRK